MPQRMNHVVRSNYFVVVLLPSRQILNELRLVIMNAVYLWRYFQNEKYGSILYRSQIKLIKKNDWSDLIDSKIKIRAEIQSTGTYTRQWVGSHYVALLFFDWADITS